MRNLIVIVFVFFITFMNAQNKPEAAVLASDLYGKIEKRNKPAFVVYWNPNCENGEESLLKFQDVINKYSEKLIFM